MTYAEAILDRLDALTDSIGTSYDGHMADGGVDGARTFCPLTRRECMGRNCAASAKRARNSVFWSGGHKTVEEWYCGAFPDAGPRTIDYEERPHLTEADA